MFSINILGSLPILLPISQLGNVFSCPKWERGAIAICQNVVKQWRKPGQQRVERKRGSEKQKEKEKGEESGGGQQLEKKKEKHTCVYICVCAILHTLT